MDGNGTHETPSWNEKTDMDKDNQSDWLEVVAVFRMYGWECGIFWTGFRDAPHVQKTFGYTTPQLKKMVDEGKVIKGTQYPAI
jgi:peptidoglycan L-alanyl-D-glutamate endopeptidase CwlK